jgi:hypothetical protein
VTLLEQAGKAYKGEALFANFTQTIGDEERKLYNIAEKCQHYKTFFIYYH